MEDLILGDKIGRRLVCFDKLKPKMKMKNNWSYFKDNKRKFIEDVKEEKIEDEYLLLPSIKEGLRFILARSLV